MRMPRVLAGCVVVAAVAAAGCVSSVDDQPPADPPVVPEILYTHVWSAEPGVDLLSRGAELVRATYEAGEFASFAGVYNSYPGYARAVGAPVPWQDPNKLEQLVWAKPVDPVTPKPGTYYNHIVNYVVDNYGISADVCTYGIPATPEVAASKEVIWSFAYAVALDNHGGEPGKAGIPDEDAAAHDVRAERIPRWDVFEGWNISRIDLHDPGTIPAACGDWWKERFPEFVHYAPGVNGVKSPPGYVIPVEPVAVQYPEWIGPVEG